MRNSFKDATIRETAEKLHEHSRHLTWQGVEIESSAFMNALESITSNGQCSFSQLDETKNHIEAINSKLKNLPRFNYDSWMDQLMHNFGVCKGMISAYLVYNRIHFTRK